MIFYTDEVAKDAREAELLILMQSFEDDVCRILTKPTLYQKLLRSYSMYMY